MTLKQKIKVYPCHKIRTKLLSVSRRWVLREAISAVFWPMRVASSASLMPSCFLTLTIWRHAGRWQYLYFYFNRQSASRLAFIRYWEKTAVKYYSGVRLLGQSDQRHVVGKRVWLKGLEDQAEAQMGQFQATAAEPFEGQGQGVDSTLLSYIML